MTVQRVDELTSPPEIGTVYLVPCVRWKPAPRAAPVLVPVLGPRHEDRSFAPLLGRHLHYDPRFLDLSLVLVDIEGMPPEQVALVIAHKSPDGEEIVYAPRVCLREMPKWPAPALARDVAPWVGTLAAAHRACRVGPDGKCPHAGTDGRSFPRDAEGAWTCIHGLRWGADGALKT